jgi:hypothetical protein
LNGIIHSSKASVFKSFAYTTAPSKANLSAMALPIPLAAPVTKQILFLTNYP